MYNYPYPGQPYGNYPPGVAPGGAPGMPPGVPGTPGSRTSNADIPPGMAPGTRGLPSRVPGMAHHGTNSPAYSTPPISGVPGMPSNFQPPSNINFSASVIRLGSTAPSRSSGPDSAGGRGYNDSVNGGGRHQKLGGMHDRGDHQKGREHIPLHPPTREEIARTIFIGKLTPGITNSSIENILRAVGGLRRWIRASDASGKECNFGFAEFDDAQSLEVASELLPDIDVPAQKLDPAQEGEVKKVKLLVMVDEESKKYASEWKSRRDESEEVAASRKQAAQTALDQALADLFNPNTIAEDNEMKDVEGIATGDVLNTGLTGDDDLADIPPEVREIVIAEIASFRERSNRRDMEILRRNEEVERNGRRTRFSSPGAHGKGANGIPLGPRDRSGKSQSEYETPIRRADSFSGITIADKAAITTLDIWLGPEDDTDASDNELEQQRQADKKEDAEKAFLDQERRWLNRERSRAAALERESGREKEEGRTLERKQDSMARFLREFDDDDDKTHGIEDYYQDRGVWVRKRTTFRTREARADEQDREAEASESKESGRLADEARSMADSFLSQQAEEIESKRKAAKEPQRIKVSFGAAAASKAQPAPRRLAAEVEGMLEDGEDTDVKVKRQLKRIQIDEDTDSNHATSGSRFSSSMTAEEKAKAAQRLASDIPNDKAALWAWPVAWEYVNDTVVSEQLVPFVEKKIVEFLGVQEQMLVDVVDDHIRKRGSAEGLIKLLEEVLDEDAEVLVKKLWRMVIFFSESEKRGLSDL